MVSDNIYLSTVQVVTLYGISLVWVLQSPLGSSLTCSVKYLIGEEPEPPVTQWRWRRRDSTPSWGTDNFLGGWGRSVNGATIVKGKKGQWEEERSGKMEAFTPTNKFYLISHWIIDTLKPLDNHIWHLSPFTADCWTSASAATVQKDIYFSGLSINPTFAFHLLHECAAIYVPVHLNMEISCHMWQDNHLPNPSWMLTWQTAAWIVNSQYIHCKLYIFQHRCVCICVVIKLENWVCQSLPLWSSCVFRKCLCWHRQEKWKSRAVAGWYNCLIAGASPYWSQEIKAPLILCEV